MERLEAEPGVIWGFLYAHWSSQPCQGWGLVPKSRAESLRVEFKLPPFPLSMCSPLPDNEMFVKVEICARARGSEWYLV